MAVESCGEVSATVFEILGVRGVALYGGVGVGVAGEMMLHWVRFMGVEGLRSCSATFGSN